MSVENSELCFNIEENEFIEDEDNNNNFLFLCYNCHCRIPFITKLLINIECTIKGCCACGFSFEIELYEYIGKIRELRNKNNDIIVFISKENILRYSFLNNPLTFTHKRVYYLR